MSQGLDGTGNGHGLSMQARVIAEMRRRIISVGQD